jgi:hypothetical protein
MRETSAIEKFMTSVINFIVVLILFIPFFFIFSEELARKLVLIGLFFAYNLVCLIFNNSRCIGMMVMKTRYAREYPKANQLLYITLYSLSFASLLFWVFFPFDLFLFNMIFIQLPIVIMKKTTLHGYLSGNITTVIDK